MSTTVTMTELKQNLGEMVRRAAFGGERIVLVAHGKEQAALISVEDLRRLEKLAAGVDGAAYITRELAKLAEARAIREELAEGGYQFDSVQALEEIREERINEIVDLP